MRLAVLSCLVVLFAPVLQAAPAVTAHSTLREAGYFIGDTATQTITVQTPAGYLLDSSSLPATGLDANSLELLATGYTHQPHNGGVQHRLRLSWQNFRAMQEIRSYKLRPLQLVFRNGEQAITVPVDAGSIVVASMLPTVMDSASAQPRPDLAPPPADIGRTAMIFSVCAVLAMGSLLLLLWRYDLLPWYSKHPPPFHAAWRALRRIPQDMEGEVDLSLGIVLLRRAFDKALGRAVSAETLPQLFSELPWLVPLQTEITAFYEAGERMLFSGRTAQSQPGLNTAQLRQLSRWLMLLERP